MSFSSFPFWSTSDINTLSSYKCIRLWKVGHSFEPHRLDSCISQAGAQHENHTWRHEGVGKSPESGSGPSRSCRHVVEIAMCPEMEKPGVRLLAVYMQEALQTRECRPQSASCGWMLIWAAGPALLAPALPLLPAFTAHTIEFRHLAQIEHLAFSGCSPAYPDHTDRLYHLHASALCSLCLGIFPLSPSSGPSHTLLLFSLQGHCWWCLLGKTGLSQWLGLISLSPGPQLLVSASLRPDSFYTDTCENGKVSGALWSGADSATSSPCSFEKWCSALFSSL